MKKKRGDKNKNNQKTIFNGIYISTNEPPVEIKADMNKKTQILESGTLNFDTLTYMGEFGYKLCLFSREKEGDEVNEVASILSKQICSKGDKIYGPALLVDDDKNLTVDELNKIVEIATNYDYTSFEKRQLDKLAEAMQKKVPRYASGFVSIKTFIHSINPNIVVNDYTCECLVNRNFLSDIEKDDKLLGVIFKHRATAFIFEINKQEDKDTAVFYRDNYVAFNCERISEATKQTIRNTLNDANTEFTCKVCVRDIMELPDKYVCLKCNAMICSDCITPQIPIKTTTYEINNWRSVLVTCPSCHADNAVSVLCLFE